GCGAGNGTGNHGLNGGEFCGAARLFEGGLLEGRAGPFVPCGKKAEVSANFVHSVSFIYPFLCLSQASRFLLPSLAIAGLRSLLPPLHRNRARFLHCTWEGISAYSSSRQSW